MLNPAAILICKTLFTVRLDGRQDTRHDYAERVRMSGDKEQMEKLMKIEEAIREVHTKPLVALWPTTGALLGLSRSGVYGAAARGEIDTVRIGRLLKVVSSSLRRKVKLEPE
jgi:hypothetical protein